MEVEGEVVGCCDEDEAVAEADEEDEDVVPVFEEADGQDGVFG